MPNREWVGHVLVDGGAWQVTWAARAGERRLSNSIESHCAEVDLLCWLEHQAVLRHQTFKVANDNREDRTVKVIDMPPSDRRERI